MAKTRVYISSTFEDLKDHRAKVIEMLEKSGDDVECMEKYAAADERPQDKCKQDASSCDIYVCILAWRYGFIPQQDNPNGKSITELEYEAAPKGRRLSFQLKDNALWSPPFMDSHSEKGEQGKLIKDFRTRVGNEAMNDFFITPDDLAAKVLAAVQRLESERQGFTSARQTRWLQEYAQKLEASFLAHLRQQQQPERGEVHTPYIEMLVRERAKDKEADKRAEVEPRPLSNFAAQASLHALVLGGGGSGKTSLLRKLAADYCRQALADSQAPLPFFARLNLFDTDTDALNGLLDVVAREVGLSREDLFYLWSDGSRRCLFLLDGLNEVRPKFINNCLLALQQLTERAPHTYLISSRSSDRATELQRQIGGNLLELEILHFDANQIKTYLQEAGASDLYDRMEDRLLALAQNPFLLWAIVQSYVNLPSHELPRNVGRLYENFIDGYIFGKREVSKPQESRPTQYNYSLVKKPALARLAVEMCQQGATRMPEDNVVLTSIRDHLYELRDANAGIRRLQPHVFMPEPFVMDLLDEYVANGILQRSSSTFEFMHESIRDYFAAVELTKWPVEQVLQHVSPLIWRHVEPDYDELHLEGILMQAVIMASGLRTDAGNLLLQLIDHHPLLAAHCFANARDIAPELAEDFLRRWLFLLDHRLARYRWVGCQCLRAARVSSAEVARRLFEVIRSDSEWTVRQSAARAFAGINDPQLTKDLVAQAVNDIRKHGNLGNQFLHLQTDTLIVELLRAWGDPAQSEARKRRVEQLFAEMRRSSVRQALQRLTDQPQSGVLAEDHVSQLAQSALAEVDSWEADTISSLTQRTVEAWESYSSQFAGQFQTDTSKEKYEFIQSEAAQTLGTVGSPEAVALLLECLSLADNALTVEAAIKGLRKTRSKQAIQPLINALRTPGLTEDLCNEIGHLLGELHGVASLIKFAHEVEVSGDEHCRLTTVIALCNCGQKDGEIEQVLLTAANDLGPRVRQEAVKGLAELKSPKAQEKLVTICLEDIDQEVREEAGTALRYFPGDAGIPKLVTALESDKDERRIRAAEALAWIQDVTAIPALVKLLESNHPLTQIAAAKALDALGFNQVETLLQVLCLLAHTAPDVIARQEAAKALREIPGGEDKLYQPIKEALTSGRYDEVVQLIGADTPFLPDDANLYWWRGCASHSLKRYQEALADLDQAIAMTNCDAIVHRTRAKVLANLNRFPDALAAAEKAAGIEPKEAMNHFLVGWYAYQAKELEKSVIASRHALELNPNLSMAGFNLGLALLALGQTSESIEAYKRGIVLCAQLDHETAMASFDGASGDLDALILERSQFAACAEEAKTQLQQAREGRLQRDQELRGGGERD